MNNALAGLLTILMVVPCVALAARKNPKMKPRPVIRAGQVAIFEASPRGLQRGIPTRVALQGTNLTHLTGLKFSTPQISGRLLKNPQPTSGIAWAEITANTNLARGPYTLSVSASNQTSKPITFYVDDLPQVFEAETQGGAPPLVELPSSFWGTLSPPGDADEVQFDARAGDSLVFDVSARDIGSKANPTLTLFNEQGALVAVNNGFDGGDPLMRVEIRASGRFRLRIADRTDAGSPENFYRISMGSFPVVTGCFPLGVQAGKESRVQLLGVNLPQEASVMVKPAGPGELPVPVDLETYRLWNSLKLAVTEEPELIETEPNDKPAEAMEIAVPAVVNGRIFAVATGSASSSVRKTTGAEPLDVDMFRFRATAGQTLVVETEAARRGSPLDTRIDVLHADGTPVERLLLQAVRDSHLTFRAIDSMTDDLRVENWQEMELRQYMYLQGEVCRIFRMPQGPDSGFQFFSSGGRRLDYFDTSPIAHALDEAVYIVEPHPPGTQLTPNGLPVFPVYYCNDDDASRKLGTDSHLLFIAPTNGIYLARVTDSRGFSGERFAYRLTVREARPDFKVTLGGANPTVNAGSGKEFSLVADRIDGFDGPITVNITNVPEGFEVSTPIVIQAGHLEARGAIFAAADAKSFMAGSQTPIRITAQAMIGGAAVMHDVESLGNIKVAAMPKLFVALDPYDEAQTNFIEHSVGEKPLEITIVPGQRVPAWLRIKRNGFDKLVTFSVENLPHGVIVDNIGLNGVLIPKDQEAREIFLSASKWVPNTDRLCFARAAQAENQVSFPVLLHVRGGNSLAAVP